MASLILIAGEEEFLMERAARDEARMSLASEILEFTFPKDEERYNYEIQTPLLEASSRAFIVWEAKEIPTLPSGDSDTLVFVCGKKPIPDVRAKRTVTFPKLKTYDDNNEVLRWILKEGEHANIDLSRIAGALFVNTGNCLRKLSSEIEKLAAAVPSGSVVTPDVARGLICFSAELTPKEIIDAICDGHTAKALAYHDRLQERNEETGWILAYMQRHVLQQLKLEQLHERNDSADFAAECLGIHPFIYRKVIAPRRGLWKRPSLTASLETLCDLDIAHKKGDDSAKFGLQLEIIRLSEEAKDVVKHR